MYYPKGVPDIKQLFKEPLQVVHKNTRFLQDPFSQVLSKSQLQQAAALNAQHKLGNVGPDGKELIPQESPRVGGFGFVATPSPAPGKEYVIRPGWPGCAQPLPLGTGWLCVNLTQAGVIIEKGASGEEMPP